MKIIIYSFMCKKHKISNFNSFIRENINIDLLLEGSLNASDRFLKKLSGISSNKIANIIYNAFKENKFINKNLTQNWVDITDKEEFITFVSDKIATKYKEDPSIYDLKSRNESRIGRFAKYVLDQLGQKVTDKEIEDFVNIYKSSNSIGGNKFELVSGMLIKKYYLEENYASDKGTLGDSCMRGEDSQEYFRIYTKNPEVCRLLVYLDSNDKVLGRALVWKIHTTDFYDALTNKKTECPAEYFMDRVYTSKDSDVIRFVNYAKENGWLYKWKMTADGTEALVFKFNEKIIYGQIIVSVNKLYFRKYPFVDTLKYGGNNFISNVAMPIDKEEDQEEGFIMDETGGHYGECRKCDGRGYTDEEGDECLKCNGDGEIECPVCRGTTKLNCKKCEGSGDIKCMDCMGNGSNDCSNCRGSGEIECKTCHGEGHKKCTKCQDGYVGLCKKCKGEGRFICPTCKDEEMLCVKCKGSGQIIKNGKKIECSKCGGQGKASTGSREEDGCKCPTCSGPSSWMGYWSNPGSIDCEECEGHGRIKCSNCKDKEGSMPPGNIACVDCHGVGENDCPNCRWGSIECDPCNGSGILGECPSCEGSGKSDDCASCKDGFTKCSRCNGTGEGKKGEKVLCDNCSGILDEFKENLKAGRVKITRNELERTNRY